MAKTLVERVSSPNPHVSIFKISGVLGYHENVVLGKFFNECVKNNINKLIIDFSRLGSLGGGCAKIIRETALRGEVLIYISGASKTVQNFLGRDDNPIVFESDIQGALERIEKAPAPTPRPTPTRVGEELGRTIDGVSDEPLPMQPGGLLNEEIGHPTQSSPVAVAVESPDATTGTEVENPDPPKPTDRIAGQLPVAGATPTKQGKDLERRLVQYRSLFSLNSDFSRIHEKSRLLDAFLLTTIAQAGAECAAFLERSRDAFELIAWKGFETGDPESFKMSLSDVKSDLWIKTPRIFHVDDDEIPLGPEMTEKLRKWDLPFVAPFIVYGQFQGVVLLGKPIRHDFDRATLDYLLILINQAAIAYQNSCLFEEESKRTLGLVQSLISMIEENTLSRGGTETMVNYIYTIALSMHYPEEHVRDLIYGTVLRDIGMIKVSDLIVRSPRELEDEEWEIIKRHPYDGAEMLRKMKFSEHTTNIVLCHHERFNGQGYPNGIQGAEIPLGARIVSVVESYAVMLHDRPTRPALSREEALSTLRENWGMRYDPNVVEKFVEIVEEEIRTGQTIRYEGSELFRD